MPQSFVFQTARPAGQFTLRPMRAEDAALIHSWVTRDYAHFWGMQNNTPEQVASFYQALTEGNPRAAMIGACDDKPAFLMEFYRAAEDDVGKFYPVQPGDYGMHLLIAPADNPVKQFSWQVFTVVMDYMFSLPEVSRVVVEPDVRNINIHRLNKRAGFRYQNTIDMGHKTAWLAFCQPEDYQKALQKESLNMNKTTPLLTGAHLSGENWTQANRLLIRKAIAEFSHERITEPTALGRDLYRLAVPATETEYQFRAKRLALDHWEIDADSLIKQQNGQRLPLDALQFIVEFNEEIGISQALLATYMEEISSTLCSSVFKLQKNNSDSQTLVNADFQTIESSMTEGHPCFVANNGRIGFDARDYLAYAPEVASPINLVWVAVHVRNAHFSSLSNLAYEQLLTEELGPSTVADFRAHLSNNGLKSEDYLFMPVHPWQWQNKLLTVFAADIARNDIVYLGTGEDQYQAQQSIRTFFNRSQPGKRYVKTALSVLNMGFMRGLSPYYMATTPAINEWLEKLVAGDDWLQRCHFRILREVAAIGYHNRYYEQAINGDSAYKKMFAALWRDNPVANLKPGQRLMTMASFLHVDHHQKPLLPALIADSGLPAAQWVERYLTCYLSPLLHCFYQHDLVFMPHGENLIMLLENNVPVSAYMKDIGEEIAVMNPNAVLPEKVQRLAVDVPENLKLLSIFTDVFDCIFRFMSAILHQSGTLSQDAFWQSVASCVKAYQQAHPQLASKFARYDLFAPEFTLSCLNRLQLANNQQMINLSDPAENLKFAGTLDNPIHQWR
ncbi:transcriptional regulator [Erwinia sp. OLTSP20]|uniref:GNAT family N-acetyltransferase n=1 Tax=unclassified Erwinia TaxID=2622719 RepID=UPI000C18AAC4|nr:MULTISPECIES: GNAT family N-acetyltransferase [unclassified Erwinia]PIJ48366.1 transcriptional regulator [Erwinia sp. OAMSP11]PIJ68481.1 transcriptional regulator [Erwinia sp. OLSSP12]PIJ78858.1 transcriptional regulator [Erwinia sp. OLCASP19]PIJ79775.1 transcriptional regulator [Erwinia sp. OLMTSP26]PIJ81277.1 transcriptional regulator [Erwinia sp. OLMDSP33]